jgi:hypothetical protein
MPSLRTQRHPPTEIVACYDMVDVFSGQELCPNPGDYIKLKRVQPHALVLANLHRRLSQAPCPLSTPLPISENTMRYVTESQEEVCYLKFREMFRQIDRRSYDISLGKRISLYTKDKVSGPRRVHNPESVTESSRVSHDYNEDYNLEYCGGMFDESDADFIAFRPRDYVPGGEGMWSGSYGKLRKGNERASFSEDELRELTSLERDLDEAYWEEREREEIDEAQARSMA